MPFSAPLRKICSDVAVRDLQQKFEEEVLELQKELGIRDPMVFSDANVCAARYAPSPIVRGEAELLGLSLPRFAVRLYLDARKNNFVNCRRLRIMRHHAQRTWLNRQTALRNPEVAEIMPDEMPFSSIFEQSSFFADAVLTVPPHIAEQFEVISTELGRIYGEGVDIVGTPYVQCFGIKQFVSHAALFVATTLLHKHSIRIYSIAEMAALMADTRYPEFFFTSVNAAHLKRFAGHARLTLVEQRVTERFSGDNSLGLALSFKSYLRTGIPILIPVASQTIPGKVDLCVVIGYHKSEDCFLIHDPNSGPYKRMDLDEICGRGDASLKCSFYAVTPSSVRLPLHNYEDEGEGAALDGLLRIAHWIQCLNPFSFLPNCNREFPGELRLIQTVDLRKELGNCCRKLRNKLLRLSSEDLREEWIWMQILPDSIWIWKASEGGIYCHSVNTYELVRKYLVCAIGNDGKTYVNRREKFRKKKAGGRRFCRKAAVDKGVITSFSSEGVEAALKALPKKCKYIELYCFMQPDVKRFLDREIIGRRHNIALEAMARGDASEAAKRIDEVAKKYQIIIRALASYLPEIIGEDDSKHTSGIRALTFLRMLSEKLNELGHIVGSIEIVGGSRVQGLWAAAVTGESRLPIVGANIDGREELIERLLRVLQEAIVESPNSSVPFAVELEPGPFYCISEESNLAFMQSCLMKDEYWQIRNMVGWNLDVGHWKLAGVRPESIAGTKWLRDRVVNIHIADHGAGHFGDAAIGELSNREDLRPWRRVIKEIENTAKLRDLGVYPRFNNFCAHEVEVCDTKVLERGFENLRRWI